MESRGLMFPGCENGGRGESQSVLAKLPWPPALVRREGGLERLVLAHPWPVNVYLDGDLLIDGGYPWSGPALLRALAGRPVRQVLVTHAHPDHAGAAAMLARVTGAEVLAHPLALPVLAGRTGLTQAPAWWGARWVHRLLDRLGLMAVSPCLKVTPVQEGDQVGRWQVLHTPGHTPCSLSLWDPESGDLMVGDCLVNHFLRPTPGVPWLSLDLAGRNRAVERLKALPARRLLFGHGPPAPVMPPRR